MATTDVAANLAQTPPGRVGRSVGDVVEGGDSVDVEEEAFENQRYIPLQGWATANLLPTDRKPWTNRSGRRGADALPRITPLPAWEWISKVCTTCSHIA